MEKGKIKRILKSPLAVGFLLGLFAGGIVIAYSFIVTDFYLVKIS